MELATCARPHHPQTAREIQCVSSVKLVRTHSGFLWWPPSARALPRSWVRRRQRVNHRACLRPLHCRCQWHAPTCETLGIPMEMLPRIVSESCERGSLHLAGRRSLHPLHPRPHHDPPWVLMQFTRAVRVHSGASMWVVYGWHLAGQQLRSLLQHQGWGARRYAHPCDWPPPPPPPSALHCVFRCGCAGAAVPVRLCRCGC